MWARYWRFGGNGGMASLRWVGWVLQLLGGLRWALIGRRCIARSRRHHESYHLIIMHVSWVLRYLISLSLLPLIISLPQARPRSPPHLLQHRPSRQHLRKDNNHIPLSLNHNNQVEPDLKSLERLVYEYILDTRGGYEARRRRLEVCRGRGGGLDTQTTEDSQGFFCCSVSLSREDSFRMPDQCSCV